MVRKPKSGSKRSGRNREEKELSAANPRSKGLQYEAGIDGVDMGREGIVASK
jgi:hypothetical protein